MERLTEMGLDLLFPRRCPLCGRIAEDICPDCRGKIHYVRQPFCFRCGRPLTEKEREYCTSCQTHPAPFTAGRALCVYEGAVRESLHAVKYQNRREYLDVYARLMARRLGPAFQKWQVDMLVPIPMYPSAKRARGYNQAELLADRLGEELGLPVCRMLQKIRKTADQKELDYRERRENLRGAFALSKKALKDPGARRGQSVLLVDDIYTTGSTISEAAKTLRREGIGRVYFATVCIVPENC